MIRTIMTSMEKLKKIQDESSLVYLMHMLSLV